MEMKMTSEQVGGLVRTAAAYGLGFLTYKGYIDAATATSLAGAAATIGVAFWSYWSKKK
jgi:hypothetical protein